MYTPVPCCTLFAVQTPTLGFTVERHQAIVAFQPEPFWVVRPQLAKVGAQSCPACSSSCCHSRCFVCCLLLAIAIGWQWSSLESHLCVAQAGFVTAKCLVTPLYLGSPMWLHHPAVAPPPRCIIFGHCMLSPWSTRTTMCNGHICHSG